MPIALGKQTNEYVALEPISLDFVSDEIIFSSDEVTAVCPVTGQRDFYQVTITLHETQLTIESKTLKLFLASLTNEPIFAENLPSRIVAEICLAFAISPTSSPADGPVDIVVTALQKSRGGVTIQATTSWSITMVDDSQ